MGKFSYLLPVVQNDCLAPRPHLSALSNQTRVWRRKTAKWRVFTSIPYNETPFVYIRREKTKLPRYILASACICSSLWCAFVIMLLQSSTHKINVVLLFQTNPRLCNNLAPHYPHSPVGQLYQTLVTLTHVWDRSPRIENGNGNGTKGQSCSKLN